MSDIELATALFNALTPEEQDDLLKFMRALKAEQDRQRKTD